MPTIAHLSLVCFAAVVRARPGIGRWAGDRLARRSIEAAILPTLALSAATAASVAAALGLVWLLWLGLVTGGDDIGDAALRFARWWAALVAPPDAPADPPS